MKQNILALIVIYKILLLITIQIVDKETDSLAVKTHQYYKEIILDIVKINIDSIILKIP